MSTSAVGSPPAPRSASALACSPTWRASVKFKIFSTPKVEHPNWDQSIALRIEQQQSKFVKTMDPSVLVAIFTLVGTSLGALITGLLQILQEKHKEKIVLVTKSGLRIEIEARNAKDKIPDLIKLLQTMEVDIIRI